MQQETNRTGLLLAATLLLLANTSPSRGQSYEPLRYDVGTPTLADWWVDPVAGNDANLGTDSNSPLRSLTEAWGRIPSTQPLTGTGYRINLLPGDYPEALIPGWMAGKHGTYSCPIIIQSCSGTNSLRIHAYLNINDVRYLYLVGLNLVTDRNYGGGGNVIHVSAAQHVLIRQCKLDGFDGVERQPQETLKANQTQHLYVEDSDISGAAWYPLDFMVVQYGHVVGCRIFDAGEWCLLIKGGSAYFRVEGNELFNGVTGGAVLGNGAGFEYLVAPWLHYDAYDIKFINNTIHHTGVAGIGVNGGYNILLAHNTLYKAGTNDHLIEVAHGSHVYNESLAICQSNLTAGGWGTTNSEGAFIPSKHVYIYNNLIYNPTGFAAPRHFWIAGPATPAPESQVSNPSEVDVDLQIRGNLIWNGNAETPLGLGEPGEGGQAGNPTCNRAQVLAENWINCIEPQLRAPDAGDFSPVATGNIFRIPAQPLPAFATDDRPQQPASPAGNPTNAVTRNATGGLRYRPWPVGAHSGGAGMRLSLADTNTLQFWCEPNYNYRVEASTNLVADWQPLLEFQATSASNSLPLDNAGALARFFRALLRP